MKINLNENNVITGYFVVVSEEPYKVVDCNFDETTAIDADINYEDIIVGWSTYIDGVFEPHKTEYDAHMEEIKTANEKHLTVNRLKAELASTDYQAIKYMEGWLTEEEYAPIKAHRQELRNQINALENN